MTRGALLLAALCIFTAAPSRAETPDVKAPVAPDAKALVARAVAAAGGEAKLLRLFRMTEKFHFGDAPEPKNGKSTTRVSVCEPPEYWWLGTKDRADEPAKFDVWGWTLGAITDAKSVVEPVAEITDDGRAAWGLRVSGTITPPMELYFDRETSLLSRIDWRSDFYRFSEWKEHDGVKYPAKCVIFKKASGKPWFFHEVTGIERLTELPKGITRTPAAK